MMLCHSDLCLLHRAVGHLSDYVQVLIARSLSTQWKSVYYTLENRVLTDISENSSVLLMQWMTSSYTYMSLSACLRWMSILFFYIYVPAVTTYVLGVGIASIHRNTASLCISVHYGCSNIRVDWETGKLHCFIMCSEL